MALDPSHESERRTRKRRVDPRLKQWGWEVTPFNPSRPLSEYRRHAIEEFPTANGPADYALVVDGQLLGVVEAKKVTLGPQNILTQAERYSRGVQSDFNFSGYRVPFLYSTNGEVFWFQDVRHKLNRSRKVAGFHTPDALREMLGRDFDADCEWFAENHVREASAFSTVTLRTAGSSALTIAPRIASSRRFWRTTTAFVQIASPRRL